MKELNLILKKTSLMRLSRLRIIDLNFIIKNIKNKNKYKYLKEFRFMLIINKP